MIDDPVQRRDFHVAIDALENVEELTDRCVMRPMHAQLHAASGRPSRDLVELVLLLFRGEIVVIEAPGDDFAYAGKAQHVVAEAGGHKPRQVLKRLYLVLAGGRRGKAVRNTLTLSPNFEQCLVALRRDADAAGIDDAGDGETVHLTKELPGAGDLVGVARRGQFGEDRAEFADAAGDAAGRIAVGVALELCTRGKIGVAGDVESPQGQRREHRPPIKKLNVDGIVGSGSGEHQPGVGAGAVRRTVLRSIRQRRSATRPASPPWRRRGCARAPP